MLVVVFVIVVSVGIMLGVWWDCCDGFVGFFIVLILFFD